MDFLKFLSERGHFGSQNFFQRNSAPEFIGSNTAAGWKSTTIVGLRYSEGVILAGDTQATMMPTLDKISERMKKIITIDRLSALGIAGSPWPGVEIARICRISFAAAAKLTEDYRLTTDGKIRILERVNEQFLPVILQSGGNLATSQLFACYDEDREAGRLFTYFPPGFLIEHENNYAAIGSGASAAESFLRQLGIQELIKDAAIRAVAGALKNAHASNAGTSSPPYFVAAISRKGVEITEEDFNG